MVALYVLMNSAVNQQPPPPLRFFLRGGGGYTQAKQLFDEVFVIRRIIRAEVSVTSQTERRLS